MLLRLAYLGVANVFALLHRLPRDVLKRLPLVVRPGYRAPLAPRHARAPARPPVPAPVPGPAADRAAGPRPGAAAGPRESRVGYRRVHGELLVQGFVQWPGIHESPEVDGREKAFDDVFR